MNIIPNGTTVKICNGEIKAKVIGCCVRGIDPNLRFEYEVVWFVGGTRNSSWVESYELEIYTETRKKAGMVNYEKGIVKH